MMSARVLPLLLLVAVPSCDKVKGLVGESGDSPAPAAVPADPKPKRPVTAPMEKDWMPPGVKHR